MSNLEADAVSRTDYIQSKYRGDRHSAPSRNPKTQRLLEALIDRGAYCRLLKQYYGKILLGPLAASSWKEAGEEIG